jgi:hypothetical protein
LNEEETIFLCLFPFCLPFYYLLYLDNNEKKKALNNIFAFNSNGPKIEYIAEKNKQNAKEK